MLKLKRSHEFNRRRIIEVMFNSLTTDFLAFLKLHFSGSQTEIRRRISPKPPTKNNNYRYLMVEFVMLFG